MAAVPSAAASLRMTTGVMGSSGGELTGTGGISGMVEDILRASGKETGACVIYDGDPVKLIERLLHVYRTPHVRKPSCFCEGPEAKG